MSIISAPMNLHAAARNSSEREAFNRDPSSKIRGRRITCTGFKWKAFVLVFANIHQ